MINIIAKEIAKKYHAGRKDRAGVDYFEGHLTTVASNFDDPILQTVAWCHDILEDTDIRQTHLSYHFYCHGVDLRTIDTVMYAIMSMTKYAGESYDEYLVRVKENDIARQVKLADLTHNMDLSRLKKVRDKDLERLEKYKKAKLFLETA